MAGLDRFQFGEELARSAKSHGIIRKTIAFTQILHINLSLPKIAKHFWNEEELEWRS